MQSFYLAPYRLEEIRSVASPDWRYEYSELATSRDSSIFKLAAAAHVDGGVRFFRGDLRGEPDEGLILELCMAHGEFCPRPYLLGQERDACSSLIVLQLFDYYCRRVSLDSTELLKRAYREPYFELWDDEFWERTKDEAEWQGIECPHLWGLRDIMGLGVSILAHGRPQLVQSLLLKALQTPLG